MDLLLGLRATAPFTGTPVNPGTLVIGSRADAAEYAAPVGDKGMGRLQFEPLSEVRSAAFG